MFFCFREGSFGDNEDCRWRRRRRACRWRRRHEGGEALVSERVVIEGKTLQRGPPAQGRRESRQPRVANGGAGQIEGVEPRQGASVQRGPAGSWRTERGGLRVGGSDPPKGWYDSLGGGS